MRATYRAAIVGAVLAVIGAARGDVLTAGLLAGASIAFLLAEPVRRRSMSVAEQLEIDRSHQAINWVVGVSTLMALTGCALIVAFVGLLLGEPVTREFAALLLVAAGLTSAFVWFLLRRAPD